MSRAPSAAGSRRAVPFPALPSGVEIVDETVRPGTLPAVHRADWAARFSWLVQGTTTRGEDGTFDLRLRGPAPADDVLERWDLVASATDMASVVHARQVHGAAVRFHTGGAPGLLLTPPADGHATRSPGVLLTVSVADCVPVFLVDPGARAVALVHAGWRGIVAGVVERGVDVFGTQLGVDPEALHVHLGPAISGAAYEVGPEVHDALGLPVPKEPRLLDLRAVIAHRVVAAGVRPARVGVSNRDVRADAAFFSHRGGDQGRQIAFAGCRPTPAGGP